MSDPGAETYQCPVCGYGELERPPECYEICPCCGTEFEAQPETRYPELRARWIAGGCKWWYQYEPAPECWDAERQLQEITQRPARTGPQPKGETDGKEAGNRGPEGDNRG
jgi:hypothetical protein